MAESVKLFIFTLCYYQLDNILKPCIYDKFEIFNEDPFIFHNLVQTFNVFILIIFTSIASHMFVLSPFKNYTVYAFSCIYIKYTIETVMYNNIINIYQYEFRRSIMWLFTTPLIIKLYCDINNVSLYDVNAHIHIFTNTMNIILYPFRKNMYYTYIILLLSFLEGYFIYKLYKLKLLQYTTFIIYIWILFSVISMIELLNIINMQDIQILYLLSDMIAKITTMIIINENEDQMYYLKNNVDLQSISLLTLIKKTIKQFENTTNITRRCRLLINQLDNKLINIIPVDKTCLKLELLTKILPLQLEDKYLTQSPIHKEYNCICVLFTDIVSYTKLAKEYDSSIIYKLLNDVYTKFDDIVIKYSNLQKIETIGDAYMVVGDIYNNDTTNNVKNIILLGLDFLKQIKLIPTPNNKPLQLRIGINIGKVVVGILGVEIPRLCVIGNTVNVAARLQSTADTDVIQISQHIYDIAENTDFGIDIQFEKKENVFLKNIGTVTSYTVIPSNNKMYDIKCRE